MINDVQSPSDPGRIPPHHAEVRPWRQKARAGTRADRMMDAVTTQIPPQIAASTVGLSAEMAAQGEEAVQRIARADGAAGPGSSALARFMIRSESVASSRIEHLEASGEDLARAIAGSRANASALSMVAASRSLQDLLRTVGADRVITLENLRTAHRRLMENDEHLGDRQWAGTVREDQNWIGGSAFSPRDALFVPPPPGLVKGLLEDLEEFVNRDDVPLLVQATVAHAQFESIHPFTDGNGRIGRALIGAVLQRRGATSNAAVPVASGLYAVRDQYFAALGSYREGDVGPLFDVLCRTASAAADESVTSFVRLRAMPELWREEAGGRRGSATSHLLDALFEHPTLTAEEAVELSGGSTSAAYTALERLETFEILREVTGRKRDRIWVVADVVDELEDLDRRIRARMHRRTV
ncbi:Fic family protein [Brachybacterium sp. FME24]|uniref:Fic family protein n=1 Tax=Brachybacterium sp. FME24 TaxID=2742605 RepID=UPI001D02B696|nr:Fic family protein [Brachybacterium sp. FME24]